MPGSARLTEERIRTWLDGDQPARERMCVHVLSLDRRFSHVRPRQPKGGPDGGFDVEATFHNGRRAVGAIGFRNSPTDSGTDQRWVKAKFQEDLARAKATAGEFGVFVFLTNVKLTVGARKRLLESAKALSEFVVEIFDREQIRVALDSPDGLAARYQFLQIPLSDAEQAAFFSRWGADLESLLTQSFAVVENRLRRLEFMHEKGCRLSSFGFYITLKDRVTIAEMPHVRAYLSMAKLTRNTRRSQWNVGVCNNSPVRKEKHCGDGPCLVGAFWLHDVTKIYDTSASSWKEPFKTVRANGGFNEFSDPRIVATLTDIDDGMFAFFMNQRLFERIATIHVYANEYLLWSSAASQLAGDAANIEPITPWTFTAEELADPWVRVMPKGFTGNLDFSSITPRRIWEARRLEQAE